MYEQTQERKKLMVVDTRRNPWLSELKVVRKSEYSPDNLNYSKCKYQHYYTLSECTFNISTSMKLLV